MTAVFLTGGSGVVGGALGRHLVAAGHHVRGLSRSTGSDEVLVAAGVEPVRGDVLGPLGAGLEGCEIVFHAAGLNSMCPRDPSEMLRVNVDGSLNVLSAARRAGVRRFVHTSSAAAIGERRGVVGRESTTHRGSYLSHYERSKHLSEQAVMAETGIEVVSVNPSSVQGPGRATGTAALVLQVVRGRLAALVDTSLSIVDIDDCARGHLLAAERGRPGRRYVLNSFTLGMREAVGLLERELGTPLPIRYLPGWTASAGAAVVEAVARLRGRTPAVCREMVRTLRHGHRYDGSLATRELGLEYTPPDRALRRLVEWFRAEGLLEASAGD